jgi:hypothetical protein
MAIGSEAWRIVRGVNLSRLVMGSALAVGLGSAAMAPAGAVAQAAKTDGFDTPQGAALPGFEQVQTGAGPANSAVAARPPSVLAGRYAILRAGGKDTGCMLTLDDQSKGRGGYRASLSPACRDQGIVIFDPAFWQLVQGRLVLVAGKGQKTDLDLQADGTWHKDPKEGKPLILKKM